MEQFHISALVRYFVSDRHAFFYRDLYDLHGGKAAYADFFSKHGAGLFVLFRLDYPAVHFLSCARLRQKMGGLRSCFDPAYLSVVPVCFARLERFCNFKPDTEQRAFGFRNGAFVGA